MLSQPATASRAAAAAAFHLIFTDAPPNANLCTSGAKRRGRAARSAGLLTDVYPIRSIALARPCCGACELEKSPSRHSAHARGSPCGRRGWRILNLAASLREPGASLADAEVLNLSVTGFAAETDAELEVGANIWLKLAGLEPTNSRVVWVDGRKAGFEFVTPLHPATLETVTAAARKPPIKRHFGSSAGLGGLGRR
jgi:hypothetical protein